MHAEWDAACKPSVDAARYSDAITPFTRWQTCTFVSVRDKSCAFNSAGQKGALLRGA